MYPCIGIDCTAPAILHKARPPFLPPGAFWTGDTPEQSLTYANTVRIGDANQIRSLSQQHMGICLQPYRPTRGAWRQGTSEGYHPVQCSTQCYARECTWGYTLYLSPATSLTPVRLFSQSAKIAARAHTPSQKLHTGVGAVGVPNIKSSSSSFFLGGACAGGLGVRVRDVAGAADGRATAGDTLCGLCVRAAEGGASPKAAG